MDHADADTEGLAGEHVRSPRGEVGDRSLFFLLDRSASLSGSEFNAIKSAVLDSLALVELALSLGNRIDLAVRFWSHGANDVSIERTDIDESDLADIIAFIEGTGQLTGATSSRDTPQPRLGSKRPRTTTWRAAP